MRALVVYNPASGQRDRAGEIGESVARLAAAGWNVDLLSSRDIREIEARVRAAVEAGFDVVVAAGGDGTLNLAAQALANQETALGVLPTGTTNVWAKDVGIPSDVRLATDVLLNGQAARMDLGEANGRYFLFVASVGFDATVTKVVDPRAKRRLGRVAYVATGLREGLRLRGSETTITVNGDSIKCRMLMATASNLRQYGGVVEIAPEACADDGLLDVWVFRGRGWLEAARHALNVLFKRHPRDPEADFYRSAEIAMDAASPLPVQLDGDYFGTTPVTLRVAHRALRVLLPPGPHPLLCGEASSTPSRREEHRG